MKRALSGRFVLRLPPPIHQVLRDRAFRQGLSINQLCCILIEEGLGRIRKSVEASPAGKVSPLLARFFELFEKRSIPVLGLVQFGSTVRDEATTNSDFDLMIILPEGEVPSRVLYRYWDEEIRERNLQHISPHFAGLPASIPEAGGIWFEIAMEGEILWEKEKKVSTFLRRIRERIAEGKFERKLSHGHPYWVRTE